jgi:hypothetical protein
MARLRRGIARFARRNGLRRPPVAELALSTSIPPSGATAMPRLVRAVASPPVRPSREYATPLARTAVPFQVTLRLSIPDFPQAMPGTVYGEQTGRTVIALSPGAVAESHDLGASWTMHRVKIPLPRACFTTRSGTHLVCSHAAKDGSGAALYRFDAQWRQQGVPVALGAPWHGSASIGESGGTILFAEYPDNAGKYHADPQGVLPARVWRSRDDGASWQAIKTVSADQIRHLHTLVPEPGVPGRWWMSSGDRDSEVFVWRSDDDGESWIDVTEAAPDVPLHPQYRRYARAVQRMTDLVFHDGWMIWGADDWLGLNAQNGDERPAPGSRIFRAPTDGPWKVEALGYCGKPVRSIVDVGPAFLFTTEAKHIDRGGRPDVFLLFKDDLSKVHHLAQIDHYGKGTGFTYSLAARAAVDGVFFSHRASKDVVPSDTRILRWELRFT